MVTNQHCAPAYYLAQVLTTGLEAHRIIVIGDEPKGRGQAPSVLGGIMLCRTNVLLVLDDKEHITSVRDGAVGGLHKFFGKTPFVPISSAACFENEELKVCPRLDTTLRSYTFQPVLTSSQERRLPATVSTGVQSHTAVWRFGERIEPVAIELRAPLDHGIAFTAAASVAVPGLDTTLTSLVSACVLPCLVHNLEL